MIIGYDMFRILTHDDEDNKKKRGGQKKPPSKRNKRLLKLQQQFREFLQDPGEEQNLVLMHWNAMCVAILNIFLT